MKYFKTKTDELYAYDDDVNKEFLKLKIKELGLTKLNQAEFKKLAKKEISLDWLKTQKIKECHKQRDEENIADYEFEGHTYRMGLDVQQDILSTLTIFDENNFIPNYTLKDIKTNEYIPFDYTKLQQLSRAVAIRKATLIFKTQKLEDAINACESKEQLEAIEWK